MEVRTTSSVVLQDSDPLIDFVAIIHNGTLLVQESSPGDVVLPGGNELPAGRIVKETSKALDCPVELFDIVNSDKTVAIVTVPSQDLPRTPEAMSWVPPERLSSSFVSSSPVAGDRIRSLMLKGTPMNSGPGSSDTVRVGNTVRKTAGPWASSVEAVLNALTEFGLDDVPHFLGVDDLNRQVLQYLPGDVPSQEPPLSEVRLAELVSWTLRFHEALRDFPHEGPWQLDVPADASIIGHNDLAPYNTCWAGNQLVGVFDWALAAPTTPLLELAQLAWTTVPLNRSYNVEFVARRLRLIAEIYDEFSAFDIALAVPERVAMTIALMHKHPEIIDTDRSPEELTSSLAAYEARLPALRTALS